MLLVGWTAIRIASFWEMPMPSRVPIVASQQTPLIAASATPALPTIVDYEMPVTRPQLGQRSPHHSQPRIASVKQGAPPETNSQPNPQPLLPIPNAGPPLPSAVWIQAPVATPTLIARGDSATTPQPSRLSLYAYSYWRWPSGTAPLAAAGQYGGSQSGLIAHYRVVDAIRLDLQFRAAITPQSNGEREVALGLRWQPVKLLPLRIIAERRFRDKQPDRFAIAIAGGTPSLHLPVGFKLESYGQAGWVDGSDSSWFFDASAQATKPVFQDKKASLSLGVGAWTGGQRGAQRLDIGPRLDLSLSPKIPLRLSADWRFRLAGNAAPENGPAVTLSSSF